MEYYISYGDVSEKEIEASSSVLWVWGDSPTDYCIPESVYWLAIDDSGLSFSFSCSCDSRYVLSKSDFIQKCAEMFPKFKVGDEVVCVESCGVANDGDTFFVRSIENRNDGQVIFVSVDRDFEPTRYLRPYHIEKKVSSCMLSGNVKVADDVRSSFIESVEKARDPYIGQQGGSLIDAYDANVSGESREIVGEWIRMWLWEPTEQDYRECCGKYVHRTDHMGRVTTILPDSLSYYWKSRDDFDSLYSSYEWNKIEGIPEQCIPKREEPRESYHVRYPLLLAGIGVD